MSDETERPKQSAYVHPDASEAAGLNEGPAAPKTPGLGIRVARSAREAIRKNPKVDRAYRTSVGVVGGATTALGVIMMPLPGPGTLVTLGGLAILSTEFESAGKARDLGVKGAKKASEKVREWRERSS
ncbi:PGPGW domain-containing protein [Actinomycetaceae bacterium MB13-C1-2]|nr:PGPGW domain-containing protein [Actinomycetaceae bacterium MB13-C1-2]